MPGMICEVTLISTTFSDDAYQTPTEVKRVIFAEKVPNHSAEFHAAMANGFDLQHTLKVYVFEYNGEKSAMYDGQVYDIYRTYPINSDWIELYLSTKRRA